MQNNKNLNITLRIEVKANRNHSRITTPNISTNQISPQIKI